MPHPKSPSRTRAASASKRARTSASTTSASSKTKASSAPRPKRMSRRSARRTDRVTQIEIPPVAKNYRPSRDRGCPCQGTNESCIQCFGSGQIGTNTYADAIPLKARTPDAPGPGLFDQELKQDPAAMRRKSVAPGVRRQAVPAKLLVGDESAQPGRIRSAWPTLGDLMRRRPRTE